MQIVKEKEGHAFSSNNNLVPVPTFIINLAARTERKEHVIKEFAGRCEFNVSIVDAISHTIGAIGLWQTIRKIISAANDAGLAFILICEDDHQFTEVYNAELLYDCIKEAQENSADILNGGVSWFNTGVQISKNLICVEKFSGLQFTIIFKKFYQKILDVNDFGVHDAADYKISEMTSHKMVLYPFISIQRDFGYSDLTKHNNEQKISTFFEKADQRLAVYQQAYKQYLTK